jgi:cation transport protein ChaC
MTTQSDLWVFGYGSLMWRPGFEADETLRAELDGWHRDFCVYSRHWRGTPDKPGLVLGLDAGGTCRGQAFRVAAPRRAEVIDYLNERELVGYAYLARFLPVRLEDGRAVEAYTFVADTGHHHYAGRLPLERAAAIIMDAEGCAGLNRDYLINTIRQLESDGFAEGALHELLVEVERQTGIIEAGAGI